MELLELCRLTHMIQWPGLTLWTARGWSTVWEKAVFLKEHDFAPQLHNVLYSSCCYSKGNLWVEFSLKRRLSAVFQVSGSCWGSSCSPHLGLPTPFAHFCLNAGSGKVVLSWAVIALFPSPPDVLWPNYRAAQ